ncbi:tail fiber protein [Thalassospira sp. GO-4]|jgi:microcystin-dependent protein|uniref:phage tail protein n=1 Tax=Thalassospira sp. GO-4 TaxID=2946605 RepID=UPI0020246C7E|nr:tail fiber protein [Thalassospira sp. GO-4]URK19426.1 tail fiber protein [Thalassospira sp. GO-4]
MQCLSPVESEVLNVVLAADIVPDRMDDTQLLQALEALFGSGMSGGGSVPVATVLPFAGAVAPDGFLICDGSELLASEFENLFSAIGITYGTGQAAGSFKLPDLRGRVPVGAGQGDGLTERAIGAIGGAEMHQLSIEEMPAHSGHIDAAVGQSGNNAGSSSNQNGIVEGGDQPHNNMQPFVVINYIIKV